MTYDMQICLFGIAVLFNMNILERVMTYDIQICLLGIAILFNMNILGHVL